MPTWYGGSTLNPDESIPPAEQWRAQWSRALRWYDRVRRIEEKSRKQKLSIGDLDIVVAFFQNCYHVRDWVVASKPGLKSQLRHFFDNHFEMGACRDICNGFKHKAVRNETHDRDFNLYCEYDHFETVRPRENSPIQYRAVFADGSGVRKFELFALARACVDLWRQFLQETDLEVPHKKPC